MGVEFRVLGDVELLVGGHRVEIGHARQQTVLLALLIDANKVVTVDQLVERVWADRPPQRARGALYNYVSRLRRILADGQDTTVLRRPGGYVLSVDALAIDLHLFDDLIARARAATDLDVAADLFTRALGLWRGEAFATTDLPWLNSVRDTATNSRIAAELDRTDIELRRGRHHDLITGLALRAAARPLDERLAGQLMLALFRCGRQADALEHYRQTRSHLAEELGIDPGAALRELHQQILSGSPALDLRPPRSPNGNPQRSPNDNPPRNPPEDPPGNPPRAEPSPRQLPYPPRFFAGRRAELAQLDQVLPGEKSEVRVVAIAGGAGIGKTSLAVHWAHIVRDRFPDGQLYVNLRGFDPSGRILSPAEAILGFLDALGIAPGRLPATPQAQAALYRSLVRERRILVLLDNARDAEQVRPLLPDTATALTVVTSRDQLTGLVATEGAHPLTLDVLSPQEAEDLLLERVGARVATQTHAVHRIITACARLPLALSIVAARAQQSRFSLERLAAELGTTEHQLDALETGDPATDVRAVFSWSYTSLTDAAARLFRLLGLHPGPSVSVAVAVSLSGRRTPEVRRALTELIRASLLTEPAPGRYTCHDLLRAYATDLVRAQEPEASRQAAATRLLDHYTHTAYTGALLLNPALPRIALPVTQPAADTQPECFADHREAMQWFAAERLALLALTRQAAAEHGKDAYAWQLAWALDTFLLRRGHWHDLGAAWQIALEASRRLGEPTAEATAHRNLARAAVQVGRHADALTHLQRALEMSTSAGDRKGTAGTHQTLAVLWHRAGNPQLAVDHSEQALALFQAVGERRGEAQNLNSVGWYRALLGEHSRALPLCRRALLLFEELGDRAGLANTLDTLGYAHHHLGDHREAIDYFTRALLVYREIGERHLEANTLSHLGDTHQTGGDLAAARDAWSQALRILTDLAHPEADILHGKLRDLDRSVHLDNRCPGAAGGETVANPS